VTLNSPKAPRAYAARTAERLDSLTADLLDVTQASTILNTDPNRHANSEVIFMGFPTWGWGPSDQPLEASRMQALGKIRKLEPRVRLLFPDPIPTVTEKIDSFFSLATDWMLRTSHDHSIPNSIEAASAQLSKASSALRSLLDGLAADPHPIRLVVDTNALIDCPDPAAYREIIGQRYLAHIPAVVLRELDDLKRSGRTPELRKDAERAVRRLKGLRDRGNVLDGVRVEGDVWAVFDIDEPRSALLPESLDLQIPDDRLVASALLLQSAHPGSAIYVATSDIGLQNKLAAVGLPFVEPPSPKS
jgi:rRNA-processing protein FCF1